MKHQPRRILFVHYGSQWLRGSERTLLDILEHLPRDQYQPFVWTNNQQLAIELERVAVDCMVSDFKLIAQYQRPSLPVGSWLKQLFMAIRLIRQHKIELIHINSGGPCQWMTLASRLTSTPCLAQIHCCYNQRDRFVLMTHLADQISCVSGAVASSYEADQLDVTVSVNHNGIDQLRFEAHKTLDIRQQYGFNKDDFVLLSVGSMIARKGYDRLIDALAVLHQEDLSVKLVLVGGGPEREALEQQIKSLGLTQSVVFAGEQTEVGGFYRAAFDAFISTARSEAFGLVNAEAALHGLAVIAPNIDGLKDIFTDSEQAQLYNGSSVTDIAEAIRALIENPAKRKRTAAAGQSRVRQHFLIEHNVNRLLDDYAGLLSRKKQSSKSAVSLYRYFRAFINKVIVPAIKRRTRSQLSEETAQS